MTDLNPDRADVKNWLIQKLEETADFRKRKSQEYPNDARNRESVRIIEKLIADLQETHDDDLRLEKVVRRESRDAELSAASSEEVNTYIGRIGFDNFPENISELLADYAAILDAN